MITESIKIIKNTRIETAVERDLEYPASVTIWARLTNDKSVYTSSTFYKKETPRRLRRAKKRAVKKLKAITN